MSKSKFNLQLFGGYDNGSYCDFSSTTAKAMAGKDILLAIYNEDGSKLLAISGQKGLTINRSADSIEITSKDTQGGWKSKIAGMKEWSIDNDGLYIPGDESHNILSKCFGNSNPVCIKIVDGKRKRGMFGGLAVITDYPIEAPFDDAVTYSLTLEGMGALVDLINNPVVPDSMPQGYASLESLTVVSVPGTEEGDTSIYINPILDRNNTYKYKTGSNISYPNYNENVSALMDWDGSSDIVAETGTQIMIIECTDGKAKKAGIATVASKEVG